MDNTTVWYVIGRYTSDENDPGLYGIFARPDLEQYPAHSTYQEALAEFSSSPMAMRFVTFLQERNIEVRLLELDKVQGKQMITDSLARFEGSNFSTFAAGQIQFMILDQLIGAAWYSKSLGISS